MGKIVFTAFLILIVAIIAAILFLIPSCDSQGGELKFWYFQPVINNGITTLIPIYKCQMP